MPTLNRRNLLRSGLVLAGAAGTAAYLKPGAEGKNHSPYFADLSRALDQAQLAQPSLIVDADLLSANIKTLMAQKQAPIDYRIVAKSLPSIALLRSIMQQSQSDKLMLFHQPFINQVAEQLPHADVLLGKPLPVQAAANFYRLLGKSQTPFNPQQQLQWLIDTPERLQQYQSLATEKQLILNVNIEIDIGLHRGGVSDLNQLAQMLEQIQNSKQLNFSGLMGYEPHIVKVPGQQQALKNEAMLAYQQALDLAVRITAKKPEQLCLNCGGSPTFSLYQHGSYPFNELSAGSCLVKPTDFDSPALSAYRPAAFIATPVLKTAKQTQLPVPYLAALMQSWNPNYQQSFFTYGGYWKAEPHSPEGLRLNPIMGRSTNQEMYNGSSNIELKPDDWLFLRPAQSEFVFLQFGDIALYQNGEIQGYWPILQAS